ncbi:cytochrome c553 [Sinobacterium caligoides]|uniref:Cytochrome c553 n=1 Tax=Sinobacterium caligoides TaxID=933926 RepID=A0A3N2E0D3_9GAMM|nr:cytochrome c [Sinobacterium caligoides]ROS05556.1 cytochrome c553 [Sinobacterium caligoides]
MMKSLATMGVLALISGSAVAADIAAGKRQSAMCGACHGATGISAIPMYPNLAGQKALYLAKQLRDFKSGERKDPVMSSMAMALSEADIENLSAYYSNFKP